MVVKEKIGEMNGGWAMMLKIALATYPLVLMWASWASFEIITMTANRWSSKDQAAFMAHHADVHSRLPPVHVSRSISEVSDRVQRLEGFHLK